MEPEQLALEKPTRVEVDIPEREVDDRDFCEAWKKSGGGEIQANHLRHLETLGLRLRGTGTLMTMRGRALIVQERLWRGMGVCEQMLEEAAGDKKAKNRHLKVAKAVEGMSILAKQLTDSQKLLVEMENQSRTPAQARPVVEASLPRNTGPPPGTLVIAQNVQMGTQK